MHDLRKEAVALSFSNPSAIFTAAKPHITILEPGTGFLKPGKVYKGIEVKAAFEVTYG